MKREHHVEGNAEFWKNEQVEKYLYFQELLNENRAQNLDKLLRAIKYINQQRAINNPCILDIGCGPGVFSMRLMAELNNAQIHCIDASSEMLNRFSETMGSSTNQRIELYERDFNQEDFWRAGLAREYDLVVSTFALHYLSDERRAVFFHEIQRNISQKGYFIALIATKSATPIVGEMQAIFRAEYTYHQSNQTKPFGEFLIDFQKEDQKAQINWSDPSVYIELLKAAQFQSVDLLHQDWHCALILALQ
jgi:cyclopropane fatty-acyl-phospholipid synthase-like methyltransferase